jgi:hypothetical protein
MNLSHSPYILYSDGKGNIFEDQSLYTTGRSGWDAFPIPEEDWIELPMVVHYTNYREEEELALM